MSMRTLADIAEAKARSTASQPTRFTDPFTGGSLKNTIVGPQSFDQSINRNAVTRAASSAADQTARTSGRTDNTVQGNSPTETSSAINLGRVSFNTTNFKRGEVVGIDNLTFPQVINNGQLPFIEFLIYEINSNPERQIQNTVQTRSAGSIVAGMGSILDKSQKFIETASNAARGTSVGKTVADIANKGADVVGDTVKVAEDKVGFNAEKIKQNISSLFTDFSLNRYSDTPLTDKIIRLPIPDGLVTQYSQDYGSVSLSSAFGPLGFAAQAIAEPELMTRNDPYLAELSSTLLNSTLQSAGFRTTEELTNILQFGMSGRVVNPQMEMLYKSPNFRQFTFDFRLLPRNQADTIRIQNIINEFKIRSSPTFCGTTTGRYYTPPAKFVFTFKDGSNQINQFLFQSKQCVITNISIDYAPNGYATHPDGSPVEIRLSLQLTETAMITAEDFLEANY